jgi:cytochrome P450
MMSRAKLPPGPKGHFVIGNAVPMIREPFDFPIRCAREFGDVVRLRLGPWVFNMLSHPEDIEYVLRGNHRQFRKDRGTRMLSSFLGQGLVTSDGELWRRQRRLTQPAFQLDQIQKYGPIMVEATERLLRDWQPGQTRDIHADMMRLTLDIVAQALFSARMTGQADRVGWAMDVIMNHFASFLILIPGWQRLPTPGNRRYRKAVRELDAVIYETIAHRRASGAGGADLLARFLAAHDEDGSQMTDQQLRDELVTLVLAGHETTALALSFCFYLLAGQPDAEARLAAEVDEVLQGQPPTAAQISLLRYAEGVVKESMRLYPPVPGIGREAVSDCEIRGYHIPKGSQLALLQWVVHRDPRWFADPEVFQPERWDNDLARRLPRCAYFPFGDGPRICIGNQFAMMEAVLILATVVQRYRLALVPGHKLELLPSVTLRPKHGIKMVVHERSGAGPGAAMPVVGAAGR